jgi:cytosine deaminase
MGAGTATVSVAGGKIAAIGRARRRGQYSISAAVSVARLSTPSSRPVLHLDRVRSRKRPRRGDGSHKAKAGFTPEIHARATTRWKGRLSTTLPHTHLESIPASACATSEASAAGQGICQAIDLQICVFRRRGSQYGTDKLMVQALDRGCRAVGGAPIGAAIRPAVDRVFIPRDRIDVDLHLDFGPTADGMDLDHVCKRTEEYQYGGRVAIGHVTKAASLSMPAFEAAAKRLADAGVALTVLPSTDLYLMGRHHTHDHDDRRATSPGTSSIWRHCSLSATTSIRSRRSGLLADAHGDLYANICQVGKQADMRECFNMVTQRPARLMRLPDYGLAVGKSADLVVLDSISPEMAVAELTPVLYAFKRGRKTVSRQPASMHRPQ